MKPTIKKINLMMLGCFLLTITAIAQGPSAIDNNTKQTGTETKATTGKYTGHWFIKSGEEFYLVKSGNLPPGLVKKTADNKLEDLDIEGVKRAVNFRKESNIDGKRVDNNYFVIEEEEGNTALLSTDAVYSKKNNKSSIAEINTEEINGIQSSINKNDDNTTDVNYNLTYSQCTGNPSDYKVCAIMVCNGVTLAGWVAINPCSTESGGTTNNVCLAHKTHTPYYYYVVCGVNGY